MKNTATKKMRICVCICLLFFVFFNAYTQNDKYLIEAESFQFKGKWFTERNEDCFGFSMLRVLGGGSSDEQMDALTVVDIREEGDYTVWVRAADYEDSPGVRLFRLSINEQPMEEAGKHGKQGFYWERVGNIHLLEKQALLRLHDTKRNYGRCDAILLLKDSTINPNNIDRIEVGKWRKNPFKVTTTSSGFEYVSPPLLLEGNNEVITSIENPEMRISFVKAGVNNQSIACRTEMKVNGTWQAFLSMAEDHKVYLLVSDDSPVDYDNFFPSWKKSVSSSTFTFEGKEYTVRNEDDNQNPFYAGNLSEAIPVGVNKRDNTTIEVQYITQNGSAITGLWALPTQGNHIEVRLSCQASQDGMYSIGLAAFQSIPDTYMNNVSMPPMYQYKRISSQPSMLTSSMMPQPLAIAEAKTPRGITSSFICGDNTTFPKEWGSVDFSPMGFSLKNERNEVQPIGFSPVLGMKDCKLQAGQVLERKFVMGMMATGWNDALEYISDTIYKVKDYRKQEDVSLTDAMFNILDLMRNEEFGGWDPALKGFYDIESDPEIALTVVHAAPLAIIGAAVFSNDEDFYISHALPTIEYTLSRSGYRWATDIVPSGYNNTLESLRLDPFTSQFTTSYYEGLHYLLGDLNPWLKKIALPGDTLRATKGYSVQTQTWVQALSAYRLTGDEKWMRSATSVADRFVNIHINSQSTVPLGVMAFYNTTFYTPWWDLLDLYDETNDEKYLQAAQYGAAHTLAGIRNFPAIEDKDQIIHPDNKYDGNTTLWWKGKEKYRLGFPRKENDVQEKSVPEWLVSPVGLGFEQPSTYFLRTEGKRVRPVFMSNWAPHLLRLFQYTQKPIYETYARNAVVGRFTNYPGYYATGYTDITLSADFPYKGPDVSSIYFHHIPPHLAFTWDYLVSEAIERSGGNVKFPYSKQEGFVWFSNRIYGGRKGVIFDDKNVKLWMRKGLVTTNNPTVNYITAISDKYFWIILSGESDKEETVTLSLSETLGLLEQGSINTYAANGKGQNVQKDGNTLTMSIPAKGFQALAFPLISSNKETTVAALENGLEIIDMGEPFGRIFVFRIRSPFGWDSVYAFAETPPVKGQDISMSVECNTQEKSVSTYPFECSFIKLPSNENVAVKINIKTDDGTIKTKELTLNTK